LCFLTQEEDGSISGSCDSRNDAEILDELTTNRGELKHRAAGHREERHLQVKNWTRIALQLQPVYMGSVHDMF
jgi:hypothetical protein